MMCVRSPRRSIIRHSRANSLRCSMASSPRAGLEAYRPLMMVPGSASIAALASSSHSGTITVSASWTKIRSLPARVGSSSASA